MIDRYFTFAKENGYFDIKRHQQARYWMYETIDEQLRNNFYNDTEVASRLIRCERDVLNNRRSSFTAAKEVLDFYFNTLNRKQ